MNNVNKTLYIPLYGKAKVSSQGLILDDKKAEEIWSKEGFELKRKSRSKWLTYFMAMRAKVFDEYVKMQLINADKDTIILHIGAGMDARYLRVGDKTHEWYDIDFADVISEREKYYSKADNYHMIPANVVKDDFLADVKGSRAIVVMEGISMYLKLYELNKLLSYIEKRFDSVNLLMDVYTSFGAKMSKYKNPINDVGKIEVYGIDHPNQAIHDTNMSFLAEHSMTPQNLIDELKGMDRTIFSKFFAGKMAKKTYRLYEYRYNR